VTEFRVPRVLQESTYHHKVPRAAKTADRTDDAAPLLHTTMSHWQNSESAHTLTGHSACITNTMVQWTTTNLFGCRIALRHRPAGTSLLHWSAQVHRGHRIAARLRGHHLQGWRRRQIGQECLPCKECDMQAPASRAYLGVQSCPKLQLARRKLIAV